MVVTHVLTATRRPFHSHLPTGEHRHDRPLRTSHLSFPHSLNRFGYLVRCRVFPFQRSDFRFGLVGAAVGSRGGGAAVVRPATFGGNDTSATSDPVGFAFRCGTVFVAGHAAAGDGAQGPAANAGNPASPD